MSILLVNGRHPICGVHRVPGNKNAALPMIAAGMLADGPVTLENVPGIEDVENMFKCAECFGAKISRDIAARTATIDATRLRTARLAPELASKIRTSVLFAGPLLARMGSVSLPPPGGDGIGHRRLDTHFAGFASLGAKVKAGRRILSVKAPKGLSGAKMLLDEASVTATENILMAAVLARGETEIYNAACEPHVQDLCAMLNSMGAKIEGAGTNRIRVEGVEALHGTTARVGCDYIEGASYLTAAAITGGEITLTEIDPEVFAVLEKTFARFEVKWTVDAAKRTLHMPARRRRRKMAYDLGDAIPSVSDGPWPMFPSDLVSILIVLATQTRGTCLFFEKMFESRLYFVDHLIGMGAKIVQCDPHRVVVTGPTQLTGSTVTSPDIRAGIALILAALCAKGRTTILNAGSVDRGYEAVEKELAALGAEARRCDLLPQPLGRAAKVAK
ncbi:MAG: UDP-N-acetylglucosamine 1-carboxyvinyltransferase [Kiritimatiellae bacterium]|nr:UDP-N-acetylglucosamine 1-carboxyvinyltransferase [Kiritimatiellia bacterium]